MAHALDANMRGVARAGLLLLGLSLGGCKLVDQTTFGAKPEAPAPDLLTEALKTGSTIPLVTIRYDRGEIAYEEQLDTAVELAEARKPGVEYDVVTAVPAIGNPADQVKAAQSGESDALGVVDEMINVGVDPNHIHMSARTDPDIKVREVRIYVH